jgi:hypothetical protein
MVEVAVPVAGGVRARCATEDASAPAGVQAKAVPGLANAIARCLTGGMISSELSSEGCVPHARVKRFVRDVLGCTCPDGVFDELDCGARRVAGVDVARLDIGGRLLVLVLDADAVADPATAVDVVLRAGLAERDAGGFNRLRLVVHGVPAADWCAAATRAFEARCGDERTHLHLLDHDAVDGLLAY